MTGQSTKSNGSGLTQLAYAYTPSEAALLISALEGAGFDVFVPGYHMMANAQHFSVAFGGAKVMVPDNQAEDAAALLSYIAANTSNEAQDAPDPPQRNWFKRIVMGVIYFFTGTAPALAGRFLTTQTKSPPK
ncbi:MAG: hypothetical protein ACSHXB_10880 [Sulfitobacter sp.]